jgi:putative hydrolase of the HAD superfamily
MIDDAIRAVFFDAVGTLLFPRVPVSQTYAEFARRHGAQLNEDDLRTPFREAFARQEKLDFHDGWRTDELRERARWRAIVADVLPVTDCEACFVDLWNWFSMPIAWSVNPEASAVLADLRERGLTLGVASNFDSRLTGLVSLIPDLVRVRDRCVVSSLVGWRKPAHEFFAAVANIAGCNAEQVLYVGDDLRNDIHGATAAGLRAVLFDPEGNSEGGLRVRRLRDLLPVSGVSQ